jgi:hypothetical protein
MEYQVVRVFKVNAEVQVFRVSVDGSAVQDCTVGFGVFGMITKFEKCLQNMTLATGVLPRGTIELALVASTGGTLTAMKMLVFRATRIFETAAPGPGGEGFCPGEAPKFEDSSRSELEPHSISRSTTVQ